MHPAPTPPELQALLWRRWGEYLTGLRGEAYRDKVFNYVDAEDTPHKLMFQLDLFRSVWRDQVIRIAPLDS